MSGDGGQELPLKEKYGEGLRDGIIILSIKNAITISLHITRLYVAMVDILFLLDYNEGCILTLPTVFQIHIIHY